MPQREEPLVPGKHYHIFNRGINSEIIFRTDRNYHFFLRRMKELLTLEITHIYAYVLMPTHYHMLVNINSNDFSTAMGRLSNSYTKAYNRDCKRTGPLFEGRFKSKLVASDEHILGLSRYMHLNPVVAHLVKKPDSWSFSNSKELINNKEGNASESNIILSFFENVNPRIGYKNFVEDGLNYQSKQFDHLLFD